MAASRFVFMTPTRLSEQDRPHIRAFVHNLKTNVGSKIQAIKIYPLLKEIKMSEAKTGRYSIGEEIYGCVFIYGERASIGQPFMMFSQDYPTDIKFIKLTVKEHHRVPNEHSDEIQHDGYILAADDGAIFTNQYPRAGYGQISDRGDRVFRADYRGKTEEDFKKMFDNEANVPHEYVTIDEVYTPIIRALKKNRDDLDKGLIIKLENLFNEFVSKFSKAFPDMEIKTSPYEWRKEDGTIQLSELWDVSTVVKKEVKEENV